MSYLLFIVHFKPNYIYLFYLSTRVTHVLALCGLDNHLSHIITLCGLD